MLKMMWFRRKQYLLVQMFLHHFLGFSIFKIFHTWSSYFDSKITIYNTLCWYSGKDTGLSPGRPQFKPLHYQGFLQKDLPWKFFKKWLSIRRITVWITSRSQLFPCPVGMVINPSNPVICRENLFQGKFWHHFSNSTLMRVPITTNAIRQVVRYFEIYATPTVN